jgi:SAM-dependent methyltransferase
MAYVLGTDEYRRLQLLEQIYDPGTIRRLERLGCMSGWHCLEVGAGGGSIAMWLSAAVGTEGSVVATDLDTKFLHDLSPNVTAVKHDIVADPLPEGTFDLIHSRFLLHLLPQRESVLVKFARALKPAGWLLCEVFDHFVALHPKTDPVRDAVWKMMEDDGVAGDWGRELPSVFQRLGFVNPQAETETRFYNGGSPTAELFRLTWMQVRNKVIERGLISSEDFQRGLEWLSDSRHWALTPMTIAVLARRQP